MVNVKRPTVWGNPVRIGKTCPVCGGMHTDAGKTLPCYKLYLWRRLRDDSGFRAEFTKLALVVRAGGELGCACGCSSWGKPFPNCHGGIMVEAMAWLLSSDGQGYDWPE